MSITQAGTNETGRNPSQDQSRSQQALENWERQLLSIREWQDAAASQLELSEAAETADNEITDTVAYIDQATKVRRGAPRYAISSIDDPEDPEHQGGGLIQEKADEFAVHVYQCIGEVGMALDSVISYLDNSEGTSAPDTEFLNFRAELLTALKEGRGVLKELGAGPSSPSNPAYQAADAAYNDDDNGDVGIEYGGQPIDTNEVEEA